MNEADSPRMLVEGGIREKFAYQQLALRLILRSPHVSVRPRASHFERSEVSANHCLVLHGWSLNEHGMAELTTVLSALPAARDWNFWDISYDAQRTTFARSARHIAAALREQPFDFERIIVFGYSMGGLVARSMIAEGLECEALVTICTPHLGLVPWWPPLGRGLRSMASRSSMLRTLNANARDRAQRHNYHFFAATYTDILGFHNHDGVVPLASALGEELGPVAERDTVHLHYSSVATFDPHWRCKHPRYIAPVLETATRLFGGEPRQIVTPPGTAEPAVRGKS